MGRSIDFIETYIDYVSVNPVSDRFQVWAAITAVSAVLERRVWVETKRRGILNANIYSVLVGPPGGGKCLAKGTEVLMFDGSIKSVEDVVVGDLLMGDDSTPRKVLSLARGKERMYEIQPTKGKPYTVNESHILALKLDDRHINISVKDYLTKGNYFRERCKGYRTKVEFAKKEVPLDPYFLGVWLGDGRNSSQDITNSDPEIIDFLYSYAAHLGMDIKSGKVRNNTQNHYISAGGRKGNNQILNSIRELSLLNNKHIPDVFKINDKNVRLQLLAGLLDTDGYLHNNGFDIIQKSEQLAVDIVYLCRSLGLAAYIRPCKKVCTNTGKYGDYFRISISGNTDIIPMRVQRKRAQPRKQIKNVLHYSIKVVDKGVGDYYGFELNGNRLFVLGDFSVTHNSEAIKLAESLVRRIYYGDGDKKIFFSPIKITPAALIEEFKDAQRQYIIDGRPVPQCPVFASIYELSDMFTDIGGGSIIPELLTYWDSPGKLSPSEYTIKKRTRKAGVEELVNPSLVLLAGTTEEYLSKVIGLSEGQTGVTARIVFVVDNEFRPDPAKEIENDPIKEQALITRLSQIYRMRGKLIFTKDAEDEWKKLVGKNNECREDVHGQQSMLEQYYNRKLTHIQKVAICCSASRSSDMTINADDLRRAVQYLEMVEKDIPKAVGMRAVHKDSRLQEIIYRYVPNRYVSMREVLHRMREGDGLSLNYDNNVQSAIEYLTRSGLIEMDNKNGSPLYKKTR